MEAGSPQTPGASVPAQPTPGGQPPAITGSGDGYPVQVEVERQEEYSRWLPLVKWLLAIPHFVVLALLGIGAAFALLIAFFAVLFTASYPRGLFDFILGVYRWALRVNAYVLLMTDAYPPFSLEDDPGYPARLGIAYPEQGVERWRPLVSWLLVIPYMFVAGLIGFLAAIVDLVAFFVILFTKRFPEGMFQVVLNALRWQARANAYGYFMVTRYPPFTWDQAPQSGAGVATRPGP